MSRVADTSFLSILMLATERKNRSNTGIPDGWVTRYLQSVEPDWPDQAATSRWHFIGDPEPDPQVQSRHAGSASQVIETKRTRIQTSAPTVVPRAAGPVQI